MLYFQQDFLWLQERYGREDCGSGLSRESSRDDINSEGKQHFEYKQVSESSSHSPSSGSAWIAASLS